MPHHETFFLPRKIGENPLYGITRDSVKREDRVCRNQVEELWRVFQPYANSKFKQKAQEDFLPFWWEMYVGVTFIKNGYNLVQTRIDQPDICIDFGDKKIWWLEATMPDRGTQKDSVPDYPETGETAEDKPSNQIILKYTNCISEKNNQYVKRLDSGVCQNYEPYIVAINRHNLHDYPAVGFPLIVKAVYPVGELKTNFEKNRPATENGYYDFRETILKSNLSPINTSAFLVPGEIDYSGISGVLFSYRHFGHIEHPPRKNFIFVHNHLARNRLPLGSFKFAEEYFIEEYDKYWELKSYSMPDSMTEN